MFLDLAEGFGLKTRGPTEDHIHYLTLYRVFFSNGPAPKSVEDDKIPTKKSESQS